MVDLKCELARTAEHRSLRCSILVKRRTGDIKTLLRPFPRKTDIWLWTRLSEGTKTDVWMLIVIPGTKREREFGYAGVFFDVVKKA